MSVSLRLQLLQVLPKLVRLATANVQDILKEFPEAKGRSAVLVLYDSRGGRIAFHISLDGGVREVNPDSPPPATNVITMHVDTFIKILKGKIDFRSAYLYDLVDIRSNDGLPASYHFLLWSAFFDRVRRLIG